MTIAANVHDASALTDLRFLWLEITGKCNLFCAHCYAESGPQSELYGDMAYGDWTRVIDEAADALKDKDERVRQGAATSLGRMGEAARAAVPALIDILKDEDKDVRSQAAGALKKIDPEAARKAGVR
jgi:hypothetical protein